MQLNVREVARLLKVSEKTVVHWINHRGLPASRVNDQYRCHRDELLEWANSRRINVSPEIFDEAEHPSPLPGAVEALQAGGIFYRVAGTDRQSALWAVVETMRLPEEADRELLFRVLCVREAIGSTGFGDGIAIPHVHNPIVLHVSRPTITLCFLEKAVEFGALDGKPVYAIFTLVSPSVRAHLHLLSRLAFSVRDPAFKEVVLCRGSPEEILAQARRVEAGISALTPQTTASSVED